MSATIAYQVMVHQLLVLKSLPYCHKISLEESHYNCEFKSVVGGGGGRRGFLVNKHHLIGSSFPPRLSHYIIGLVASCTNGFRITEGRELSHLHAMEFIQTHGQFPYT